MRRFASLFKRNDKSDTTTVSSASSGARSEPPTKSSSVKKQSRFFRSLSLKAVQTAAIRDPQPPVPQPPLQAYSSSSSSTDSPAPATPDDDSEIAPSIPGRKSDRWSERKLAPSLPVRGGSLGSVLNSPGLAPIPTIARSDDSEELDDGASVTSSSPSIASTQPVSPHAFLHSLTTCALAPAFSTPPLLHLPNVPLFPRSANPISALPYQETTASTLHRTQLLRRLTRRDLSASEERSITSFTSRRTLPAKPHFLLPKSDNGAFCDVKRVSNVSRGLQRWISRPCFEDRMSVYTLGPSGRLDDIVVQNVTGGALGVEALEVSETIEVLAGYNVEEQSEVPWLPTLSSSSTTDLQLPLPSPTTTTALNAQTRNQPYKASPSPLRIGITPLSSGQTKALKPILPLSQPAPVSVPSSSTPANVPAPRKRTRSSVRFDVEEKEDKDDHVPLGQVMRIKRGREDRAKFLELEKGRRALEEERLKHQAEKKKWEQEKRAWEAERTAAEDEKKKRLYQQEVIAARKRRESQMFKVNLSSVDLPEIQPPNSRRQGSYSRPAYDTSRRESSDGSSPGVSYPPSRNESFNSLRGTSKPQSIHSAPPPSLKSSRTVSSAEDVTRMLGRRSSVLPETPPQSPMLMQPYGYPWGVPMMPQMPMQMSMPMPMPMQMAPQMPYYTMDNTPLLPPTAPFMMQRTGDRRQSSSSNSPNRVSTSLGKAASQSADRLPLNQGTSPTRRPAGHQRSSSGESDPNQPGHGQRSNQGSVNSNRRPSGTTNDQNQWRNSTRSRPSIPPSNSQGSGSWVVPSPGPPRRLNTVF